MKVIETLLDLNKWFFMDGYASDFTIQLRDEDFERLFLAFEKDFHRMPVFQPKQPLHEITSIRLAGPGSYFLIERKRSP